MNDIKKSSEQILEAIQIYGEDANYCRNCESFFDGVWSGHTICDVCGSDETENGEDLEYHLDVALEQERQVSLFNNGAA